MLFHDSACGKHKVHRVSEALSGDLRESKLSTANRKVAVRSSPAVSVLLAPGGLWELDDGIPRRPKRTPGLIPGSMQMRHGVASNWLPHSALATADKDSRGPALTELRSWSTAKSPK